MAVELVVGQTRVDVVEVQGGPPGPAGPAAVSPSAFELRGTGMPNGVVTASVGTYYTDTNATNGAIRWVKASGTGNGGWRVLWGDTGWRDIAGLLAPDFVLSPTAPHLRLKREGNQVYLTGRISPAAAIVGYARTIRRNVATMPSGFTNWPAQYSPVGMAMIGNTLGVIENLGSPTQYAVQMSSGNWQANEAVAISANWSTTVTWPTTLPGTAVE